MRKLRWSGDDFTWGPFLYSKDGYHMGWSFMVVSSGDIEENPAHLRITLFGRTVLIRLPDLFLRPYIKQVMVPSRFPNVAAVNYYWEINTREFGVYYHNGYLSFHYGRQAHDSSIDKHKGFFMPWRSWRHVRSSYYNLAGQEVSRILNSKDSPWWEQTVQAEDKCPRAFFPFKDFDDELIIADTYIEEREFRRGEGRWSWLSIFSKPRVTRSLSINFNTEMGIEKRSWKGGVVGTSIPMLPGELHEQAFRRFCDQSGLKFYEA